MAKISAIFASLAALASVAVAVNPIIVKEQEFVDSVTGKRFVVRGVDYQPGGQGAYTQSNKQDPLSNADACLRDAALLQQLGANAIRSYNVDPTLNHDACASIFNEVGIYMILDVNSPLVGQSLDRSNPGSSYYGAYLEHLFSVVEAFKSYNNTLGFFSGNEIINDVPTSKNNPPYIRAVQRDLKSYIAKHASRPIPVGYSAADVREVLQDSWAYFQCDNSADGSGNDLSRSDFFGLNSYSWCGSASSFTTSGYDQIVAMFGNTTIPVFFSEYGCNKPQPRVFDEVQALYGPQMTVLSGGLVYEWTEEPSDYGIVDVQTDGSIKLRPDFAALQGQYAKLNITLLESANDTATSLQPPKCDASLISSSGFSTNFKIPDSPPGVADMIANGISNPPSGTMVAVTQTAVQLKVYNTDGSQVTGLAISPLQGANVPDRTLLTSNANANTGSNSTTGKTSTGAASRLDQGLMTGALAIGAAVVAVVVL